MGEISLNAGENSSLNPGKHKKRSADAGNKSLLKPERRSKGPVENNKTSRKKTLIPTNKNNC